MRRTGLIVGVLFIIATAFLFLGEVFYKPFLDAPDVLTIAAQNKPVIVLGLMIELICILAMPLIGAFIYPILRRLSTGLALSYFFFRSLEAIILTNVALTNKFALLSLSEAQLAGADPSLADGALMLIRAQNVWADTAGMLYNIIFALGAICLYGTLFYARLIPRWISLFGLIAIAVLLVVVGAAIFVPLPSWGPLLIVPIGVQEMVMALWFIFRGFDFRAITHLHPHNTETPA
ncbi:DUF4386 domain-containing protein [Aliiroseovarius sp. S1339]|uniref:DUF4386 domain-containing protein n=1 Tax=Aliiroseovarius sp. S1339 TaxID=2936990 RepID=UPI0020BFE87D|nr:DUF4386 domain-containing protein [Aliiroseovarius sp. S1339]MCK8462419.1 DUF4386 domain-containing protein [Aliiroseovarius sp. S1339]